MTARTDIRFILFSTFVLCQPSVGQVPNVIRVPQDHRTIQSAINSARAGDTVLVDHGTYFENVRIAKNVVVASRYLLDGDTSHISQTVIDGSRPRDRRHASVIFITGLTDTTCEVRGFTLQGGSGTFISVTDDILSPHWVGGGGVLVLHAGARIARNIVTRNVLSARPWATFTFGAGIAATGGNSGKTIPPLVIIEENLVVGNTASGELAEGGGIEVIQPGIVRHNVVMYNRTYAQRRSFGGGVYVGINADYDVYVEGNEIRHNVAGIGGGMLITCAFVRRGRAIVSNNLFVENQAFEVGGAVNVAEESYAIFAHNTIVRNRSLSTGGGINVTYGSHAVLVNNILWANEIDQVSTWGVTQAMHNLVQGGLPGKENVDVDPGFRPADSLYRLAEGSPCIGSGLSTVRLADRSFQFPSVDADGAPRRLPFSSKPDLGARETAWESGSTGVPGSASDGSLKLTVKFQQLTPSARDMMTGEIVRAGTMQASVFVNDAPQESIEDGAEERSFTLDPGDNLLEIEVIGRARDTTVGIPVYVWLDGSDRRVTILRQDHRVLYHSYSGLRPGSYRLSLQPQDDSRFIGHTNRVSFLVTVAPFWYQRWWAYAMYAFSFILMSIVVYRSTLKRQRLADQLMLEHQHAEKLGEIDRTKSRFLANISHELRTPLTMILGPIDALRERVKGAAEQEQLDLIDRSARRLLRMIELLLQFSRIEAGSLRLRVSEQPVVPLLRRIASMFTSPGTRKGITVRFNAPPEEIVGCLDAEKVEHIVENLLSNALKFTPAGGTVEVSVTEVDRQAVILIRDNGVGISDDDLPHIFERFHRIDTTHKTEGTGIGLSLTKELVEIHRGTITIESAVGEGTTFTVRLPLQGYGDEEIDSPTGKPEGIDSTMTVSPMNGSGDTPTTQDDRTLVLVAEDNDDARAYIRSRLSPAFAVIECADGRDALVRAQQQVPDVVISDVMMPGLDGYELCRTLKSDERTSHIPVILLTALAEREERLTGLGHGADDYVAKPFDARELLVRVRNLIENRKRLQEKFRTAVPLKPGDVAVHSLDETFLSKAKGVVEAHMGEPEFSTETFAHEVFVSRTQLHRKLKALTGMSANEFVRYLRLHRAKQLLEKQAGSIAEIADRCGFLNHSYFAKAFRELFGKSPSEMARK